MKLDIKDEFQQKRVLGGSMSGMLKYEGGGDPEVKENNSKLKKREDDGDEKEDYGNNLYLDINDNNKHYKVKGGSVMGMKPNDSVKEFNIGYAAVREDLLKKGEISDSNAPLELVLDPDDSLMRRKVTGGSSMGFTPNSEGNPGVRSSRDLKNENSESYLLKRTYTPIEKETESKSESKSESG